MRVCGYSVVLAVLFASLFVLGAGAGWRPPPWLTQLAGVTSLVTGWLVGGVVGGVVGVGVVGMDLDDEDQGARGETR